ncbi:MAG: hypothetical protein VR64_22255 [Desulfatitalea sp. BRH_c12]|nr:MAG: hypothetical protein VR64_22255 [Desulfatitalea sp. BRH_c12]
MNEKSDELPFLKVLDRLSTHLYRCAEILYIYRHPKLNIKDLKEGFARQNKIQVILDKLKEDVARENEAREKHGELPRHYSQDKLNEALEGCNGPYDLSYLKERDKKWHENIFYVSELDEDSIVWRLFYEGCFSSTMDDWLNCADIEKIEDIEHLCLSVHSWLSLFVSTKTIKKEHHFFALSKMSEGKEYAKVYSSVPGAKSPKIDKVIDLAPDLLCMAKSACGYFKGKDIAKQRAGYIGSIKTITKKEEGVEVFLNLLKTHKGNYKDDKFKIAAMSSVKGRNGKEMSKATYFNYLGEAKKRYQNLQENQASHASK